MRRSDPPARDFVSGRCREGPRGGRERARRADMRQRASHGCVSWVLNIAISARVSCEQRNNKCTLHVPPMRCEPVYHQDFPLLIILLSLFAIRVGMSCGRVRKGNEGSARSPEGHRARRGSETQQRNASTFAPCPRETAPKSRWYSSCVVSASESPCHVPVSAFSKREHRDRRMW